MEHGVWIKKGDNPYFDVTMGSYDGAEICELVGLYLLYQSVIQVQDSAQIFQMSYWIITRITIPGHHTNRMYLTREIFVP